MDDQPLRELSLNDKKSKFELSDVGRRHETKTEVFLFDH